MRKRFLPILAILLMLVLLIIGGCDSKEIPIDRIAITSLPKLNYLKGETFELDNAMVTVYYSNGKNETFPLTFEMVSDYNPQKVGEHMLSIRYENATTNIKIRISNAPIVNVEPVQGILPYKTQYIEEQELDISNLKLKINYESGDPDIIDVTEDMIEGFDDAKIGQQEIIIRYLDEYVATYTVTVREKKVSNISILEIPDKKLYLLNEKIDFVSLAGGKLHIAYDNGFTETKNFEDLFSTQEELDAALSYNNNVPQKEIVTLNYEGKSVIFDITVLIKKAESFELLNKPTEAQIVGTDLSLRGGRIKVYYNNKTDATINMDDEMVVASGYSRNTVGLQTITLAFNDINEKFQFAIEVLETTPIELEVLLPVVEDGQIMRYSQSSTQQKVVARFYQESTIDLSLWEYRLKMNNDSYSAIYVIDEDMLEGENEQLYLENYGTASYAFSYIRDNLSLSATVDINVIKKELMRIEVTPPTSNVFYLREELVLTGATFTAYFNDGSSFTDDITRGMVSGYNNAIIGNQDVIVTYNAGDYGIKVSAFKVDVIRKAISIEFESVFKTVYVLGEEFDQTGLAMRIHYENLAQSVVDYGPFGAGWSFHNTVFNEVGQHNVIVKYQAVGLELTTNIPVTVKNDLVSIELLRLVDGDYVPESSLPDVVVGMPADLTDLYLKCTLENGFNIVPLTNNMIDYQRANLTIGTRPLKIIYGDKEIETTINVVEREIESLEILSVPEKKYYKAMEEATLDIDNLRMRLSYTNNTNVILDENTLLEQNEATLIYRFINKDGFMETIELGITPLDTNLEAGIEILNKRIDIIVDEFNVGFDIIIAYKIATAITWWDISTEIEEQPAINTLQGINEIDFPTNSSFKVIYNEGEFDEIVDINSSLDQIELVGFDYRQSGMQVVELRYQDIYLNTVINVRPKDLKSISFVGETPTITVTEGMPLDLRNIKIEVTYCHHLDTEDEFVIQPSTIVSLSASMTNYNRNNNTPGIRQVDVIYTYTGSQTVTKTLNFNINVVEKKLIHIGMGMLPKTKYIELDQFSWSGGTIILYYDNNTTATKSLEEADRVRSTAQSTSHFILNYGQFNNEDFSGFSRKQQIYIIYKENDAICTTSYDIIMHDRLYAVVEFTNIEEYNQESKIYYFWYGEDRTLQYRILGYSEHTDIPDENDLAQMDLVAGLNYTFKYINDQTGEEFASWPRDAGTYTIYIHYDAELNEDRIHNSFVYNERKVVINRKNIHIEPNSITKVYGENNPQFTSNFYAVEYREKTGGGYDIIYHTDNVFGYNEDVNTLGGITYECLDNASMQVWKRSPVGAYTISLSVEENRNYNITFDEAEFVITKRKIVIMADAKQKEYGQGDPAFTYTTATVLGDDKSGYIQGDFFSGNLSRQTPSANNGVGEYIIWQNNLNNNNYEIEYISNTLTITKRKLILTAKSYNIVYGQNIPQYEVTPSSDYQSAFAYSDTLASLGGIPVFDCDAELGSNVGSYDITPSGYTSNNYDIEFVGGTLTINLRPINVYADTGQSKIYGYADGALSYINTPIQGQDNSGIFNGEDLVGTLQREVGEDVGEYQILQGDLNNANNPNYDIIYHSAIYTINKREAKIEIITLTKEYNGLLPEINAEDYIIHIDDAENYAFNPSDIKENIDIGFDAYVSKNKGTYSVEFLTNDENHNISFLAPNGYLFTITTKFVTTEFYNIPYGNLEGGEYAGSVYKSSAYHYEARVPNDQICEGDTVDVVIHTAEIIGGADPIYIPRNTVTYVGKYSVKVVSLSNSNYSLRLPTSSEIEEFGDYRVTEFSIIPATIKILMTIPNMSKEYKKGLDILFDNSIINDGGTYKTSDYTIISEINFKPDVYVYPYYLINVGQENQTEMFPKNVIYEDDEFGNRTILGYNIKATSRNNNYVAVLVDEDGQPIERDGEEIIDQAYRFKVVPLMLSFGLGINDVVKEFDNEEPTIDLAKVVIPSINKEQHLKFRFSRINNPSNPEYAVPAFMEGHIADNDCGMFDIIPYSTDPNYDVILNEESAKVYTIRRVTLYQLRIEGLTKAYDGQMPTINKSLIRTDNYLGSNEDLSYQLVFEGGEQDFYANPEGYKFSIKFNFPEDIPHNGDGYDDCLDFNHRFVDSQLLSGFTYVITKRNVYVSMIDGENITWKYYNGLQGALIYIDKPAGITSDDAFREGYLIEDALGSSFLYEGGDNLTTLLKSHQGRLSLSNEYRVTPGTITVNTNNLYGDQFLTTNFNINKKEGSEFLFTIYKQIINFHIESVTRPYGESLSVADYTFALNSVEKAKVVLPAGYGDQTPLFGNGIAVGSMNYIFQLSHFAPYAEDGVSVVNYLTSVGEYTINCDIINGQSLTYYTMVFDRQASGELIIERRELPVLVTPNYTIQKIFGEAQEELLFVYEQQNGSKGYMIEDEEFVYSSDFIKPAVNYYQEPSYIQQLNVGIYQSIIEIDDIIKILNEEIAIKDAGQNDNYYFTYFNLYDSQLLTYVHPDLEVIRADLEIKILNEDYQNFISAVYGEPPTEDLYNFMCTDFKGRVLDLISDQVLLSNLFAVGLPATTIEIGGEMISFDATSMDFIFNGNPFSLTDILYVDFNKSVIWDEGLQVALTQPVAPQLVFAGSIQRLATNGLTYEYTLEEPIEVYLRNYNVIFTPINYQVTKRPIKVELENLNEEQSGDEALFNILWDEVIYTISKEMILLYLMGKDNQYGYTIEQNGIMQILLDNFSKQQIVTKVFEAEEIIIINQAPLEQSENGKEYFLRTLAIEYTLDPGDIDNKYSLLSQQQKNTVIEQYDYGTVSYEYFYTLLTIEDIESVYNQLVDEELIGNLYEQLNISQRVMEYSYTEEQIVKAALTDEEIIIKNEFNNYANGKEYFLIELEISYSPEEIDTKYSQLTQQQIQTVIAGYIFNETVYNAVYSELNETEWATAAKNLFNLSENQEIPQQYISAIFFDMISSDLNQDQQRLLFNYLFDLEELVYGDTIGIGIDYAIDISGLTLDYTTEWGENKLIKAKGVMSNNYEIDYVQSNLNIYRYVLSIGIENQLPNIMVKGSDPSVDFVIKVNYIDGNSEYIDFINPRDGLSYNVDYYCEFNYISSPVNMTLLETNQSIKIEYYEEFFGYKDFVISSTFFDVRVKDDVDELLWARNLTLDGGYTGGTFISTNGNKDIGEKIEENYTYYITDTNPSTKGLYNFDILKTKFRLEPKAGESDYYFEIVLNGDASGDNYLALRFVSGAVENVYLVGVYEGEQRYYHSVTKPGDLDIFDGRMHEITAYIDKLGTRENDVTGYKLLVVIDNGAYFNFTNLDKAYPPQELSVAGFEANDCYAWISDFRVSTMGIKSSRALKIVPSSNAYYSQNYSITGGTKEINLTSLVDNFTFHSSSYVALNNSSSMTYDFLIDGEPVSNVVNLPIGIYELETRINYDGVYMDSIYMYISISNNYTYETLSHNAITNVPYMSKPVTYYGYTYPVGNDMEISQTTKAEIVAQNYKNYKYYKTVFDLDVPSGGAYPGSFDNWDFPYNAAFILKTTDANLDLRDPSITISTFNAIGIYVRYDGSVYHTTTYIRINGAISYTSARTDIDWSGTGRTVIEAVFDEGTGNIIIYIRNGSSTYTMRYMNGYSFASNDIATSTSLLPLITNTSSTSRITLYNTRLRMYQMESGFKKIIEQNYYNLATGEFIVNTGTNSFSSGTKLFLDNGNNSPLISDYTTYNITFKGTEVDNGLDNDYFKLHIGTNLPNYNYDYDNRGFYIAYKKVFDPYNDEYIKSLYFGIYKATNYGEIKRYREQHIGVAVSNEELTEEDLGYAIIDDVLDGQNEYTITVKINREIIQITDPLQVSGLFTCSEQNPMSTYRAEIYINGAFMRYGYIPVTNNLSNWRDRTGNYASDSATGMNYDLNFLSSNLYPGLEVISANMDVSYFNVI